MAMRRTKEVGIKLIFGSRLLLVGQFFLEFLVLNFFAIVLATGFALLFKSFSAQLLGDVFSSTVWSDPVFWTMLLGILILGTLLAGLYPAFLLSSFKPIEALKEKINASKGLKIRRVIAVVQFGISIALITGAILIYSQTQFIRNHDIGLAIDKILIIKNPSLVAGKSPSKWVSFKNSIEDHTGIKGVAGSTLTPGLEYNWTNGGVHMDNSDNEVACQMMVIDINFPEVYDLKIREGEDFFIKKDKPFGVIINAEAASKLGVQNVADNEQRLVLEGDTLRIVSVFENFYQQSVKLLPQPMVFYCDQETNFFPNYFSVKLSGANISSTIDFIKTQWETTIGDFPFEYYFLDDQYNKQYAADIHLSNLLIVFTVLSIIISCLGLLGLTKFNVEIRTKDIGVRKILGSTPYQIMVLFFKEMFVVLIIAFVLAAPLTFMFLEKWFEQFPNRIAIGFWPFVIPLILIGVLATAIISAFTVKVASSNPARLIRQGE
jgi:putative ABC transport system permease protein